MNPAGDRRLLRFLAISLVLHMLWLAIPLRNRAHPPEAPLPLVAHMVPRPDQRVEPVRIESARKSAVAARLPETPLAPNTPEAFPPARSIDIDAAFATARSQAREAPPRPSLDAPKPQLTIEAAVARATQRDELIETHGASGEYVTRTRHSRCVTPTYIPHFLEGKTMLTQCEALKG